MMKKLTSVCPILLTLIFLCATPSHAVIDGATIEGAWLFDGNSADIATDSSGHGRHGAITGAKRVNGKFGSALEFDGVGDQVVITDYFGVGGTDPRTTVLWFKGSDAIEHSWVKWGVNADTQKYYIRSHVSGAECYLRIETQGGQHYGSTNVCDGEWHHLAVVFPDGSDSVKDHLLYVDGVLEAQTAGNDVGVDTDNQTTEVHIGAPLAHHVYAKGVMDEISIFNVALSENDIKDIMANGLAVALAVDPAGKLTSTWGWLKQHK